MGNVRFIGDLHLGHENMATKRGFTNAAIMADHIAKCWNSVVNKKDVVYIVGDVTMEKKLFYPFLDCLNGRKYVVLGNHDRRQDINALLQYVDGVVGMVNYKKKFIITHPPIHPSELDYRYSYNIHGHVHENSIDDKRYINVSAENIDYTPRTLEELLDHE